MSDLIETTVETPMTRVATWDAGRGHPLLAIHGLGLDHVGLSQQLEQAFDGDSPWRRIYVDLPGMGETPGHESLASADVLLDVLIAVIDEKIGDGRFAVLGQSYGGYLGLGVLKRFSERVSGLALLIPVVEPIPDRRVLPAPIKLKIDDEAMGSLPEPFLQGFRDLIVEESSGLATALTRSWIPSMDRADEDFIELLQTTGYAFEDLDLKSLAFAGPSLLLCGRHDAVVGYAQAIELLAGLDRSTLVVLDGAGHLVQLEKQGLSRAVISDWIRRVEDEEGLAG